MAKTKTAKRKKDIKSKLMAAICMLLVSTIMMVSSTYAWFTLSTAPEVTGITTAVGANGNLEMALMPATANTLGAGSNYGITSGVNDGATTNTAAQKNVTWGNLVDVSDTATYGLDKITLFPSRLNPSTGEYYNPTQLNTTTFLATPKYGADGRISELVKATVTGVYDGSAFQKSDNWGVRAVGTASGMTERELAYRNALAAGNTAKAQAANEAKAALDRNGSALANIAIKHGIASATESYNKDDVQALRAMIDGLKRSMKQLDKAYMQYIVAYAASTAVSNELAWNAINGKAQAADATLAGLIEFAGQQSVNISGTDLNTPITAYQATVGKVNTAETKLAELETTLSSNPEATFTWTQISEVVTPLANPSEMTINGYKASEVKAHISDIVSSVTAQGGLTVKIATGGGVFADVADHCGDFSASVVIEEVEYNGIVLNNMKARMETASTLSPTSDNYLIKIHKAIALLGAPTGENTNKPITDMYGFIVDLAFRTNAAESKLLLQSEAADRIYANNTNEQTMGHGTSMTFQATTTDFSDEQVKSLMDAIRIVFFDPTTGNVIALGKLDVAHATSGTDGITAKIVLYTVTEGVTYAPAEGTGADYVEQVDYVELQPGETGNYISDGADGYREIQNAETGTHKKVVTYSAAPGGAGTGTHKQVPAGTIVLTGSNEIMPLTQNTAHALSILVYLDGDVVGNDDVAATAATSMTGKLNLQFASSATLVPMEYADLHIKGSETP